MLNTRNNYVKIGISIDVKYRERTLQAEEPEVLCLYTFNAIKRENAFYIEQKLHRTFSEKRLRGEWFSLSSSDIELIPDLVIKYFKDSKNEIFEKKKALKKNNTFPVKRCGTIGFTRISRQLFDSDIWGRSKLIYAILLYHKFRGSYFTPGVRMLSACYGVGIAAYRRSKVELESAGFIGISKARKAGYRDTIFMTRRNYCGKYEKIPNCVLVTPCFTPQQKLFIILLYFICDYGNGEDRKTPLSPNQIATSLIGKGIGGKTVLKCIKELMGDGYVPILYQDANGLLCISEEVIRALYNYRPALSIQYKYPIYEGATAGSYYYNPTTRSIIKNNL